MKRYFFAFATLALCLPLSSADPSVSRSLFGSLPTGEEVELLTLRNEAGMAVSFMEYGATMVSVRVPDSKGEHQEVTARLDTLEDYLAGHPLLGSTVGRFANRIDCRDTGGLVIDGEVHPLASVNRSGVHIHGGPNGFQKQLWKGELVAGDSTRFLLRHRSPDGHEGYPGNLDVTLAVSLSAENEISLAYEAKTDAPTHLALTNHVYWNLGGIAAGAALGHELELSASRVLEFDERKVPTGKFLPVAGTPLDFHSQSFAVGQRIADVPGAYDHAYAIDGFEPGKLSPCARLHDPRSGRTMIVTTTEPGVQLYSGNALGPKQSHQGVLFSKYGGLCLETQHFPNSPNLPEFPSTLLRPGETFHSQTVYRFEW